MVDLWVVTDRSEPKYHQRLLGGEVLLFLLPNRKHHSLRNGEAACSRGRRSVSQTRPHDVKSIRKVGGGGELLLVAAGDKMTTCYEVSPN